MYRKEKFPLIKKKTGYVSKLDVSVPHQLTADPTNPPDFNMRFVADTSKNDPFLKNIITGDEKWIVVRML